MLISIILSKEDCQRIAERFSASEHVQLIIDTDAIESTHLAALSDKIENAVRIKSYVG